MPCCIRVPSLLPAYTPLISNCLQRYQVKDRYLCRKESLSPARQLIIWKEPTITTAFHFTFFLCSGCLLLISSCGPCCPIRLWNMPAKGRLTLPIREDGILNPVDTHYFKWDSCERTIWSQKAWTSFTSYSANKWASALVLMPEHDRVALHFAWGMHLTTI